MARPLRIQFPGAINHITSREILNKISFAKMDTFDDFFINPEKDEDNLSNSNISLRGGFSIF